MSITTEISRITKAKEDIRTSLVNKGATISETAKLDEYSAIIDEMTIGSGGTITDSDGLVLETEIEKYSGGSCGSIVKSVSFPKTGITSLSGACAGMINLRTVKRFPIDVTDMDYAFQDCTSLTSMPNIPTGVTHMRYTFNGCTGLTGITNIPTGVTDLDRTFSGCTSLVSVPTIPDSVTNMDRTFDSCTGLTSIPNIPTGLTRMPYAFTNCTSLISVPTIPDSVVDMGGTFENCTSLKKVPEIRVTSFWDTFKGCSSLEEVILNTHSKPNFIGTFNGCPSTLKIYVNEGLVDYCKTDSETKDFTILPIEKRWYQYDNNKMCDYYSIYGVRVKEFNGPNYRNSISFSDDSNNKTYLVYNTTEKRFETYTVINDVTSETTVLQPDEDGYYKIMFDKPVKSDSWGHLTVELFI